MSVQLVKGSTGDKIQLSVKDFSMNFNIKRVNDNIGDAHVEVSQSCMNGVSRNIWSDAVTDIHGFDPEEIENSRHAIFDMAMTVGYDDAD
jgi:hypothetical protein